MVFLLKTPYVFDVSVQDGISFPINARFASCFESAGSLGLSWLRFSSMGSGSNGHGLLGFQDFGCGEWGRWGN